MAQRRLSSPDVTVVCLIAALSILFVADRLGMFGLAPNNTANIRVAAIMIAIVMGIELTAFLIGVLRRRPRQYGIRCLLLLTLAAAIPANMYACQNMAEKRRQQAIAELKEVQARILTSKRHRQMYGERPALTLKANVRATQLTSLNFSIEEDLGCGCCYDNVRTDVADNELAALSLFRQLEHLNLADTAVTDDGVRHLRKLNRLKTLNLSGTKLSNDGMKYLSELTGLEELILDRTQISDAGLVHLEKMRALQKLRLNDTRITDAGFRHFGGLTNLTSIEYARTRVIGYVAGKLANCTKLEYLTQSTIGAEALNSWNDLASLQHISTRVMDPSPSDEIRFEGHRNLAAAYLTIGQPLRSLHLKNLPALEGASIEVMRCQHNSRRTGQLTNGDPYRCDLCSQRLEDVRLEDLPNLQRLNLYYTPHFELSATPNLRHLGFYGITDAEAFRKVQQLQGLHSLSISDEAFTDASAFLQLGSLPHLQKLHISGAGVTDESLAMLLEFPKLRELTLPAGDFSAEGLQHLRHLPLLERLVIGSVLDTGEPLASLSHLSRLKRLEIKAGKIGTLRITGLLSLDQFQIKAACDKMHFENLPKLTQLWFSEEQAPRGLSVIDLPTLTRIRVDSNKHQMLEDVRLETLPSLTELRIGSSRPNRNLTDTDLSHLETFQKLKELDLSNSRITTKTAAKLADLPNLEWVYLYNTPLGDAAIQNLKSQAIAKNAQFVWAITPGSGLDANGNFK